MKAARIAQYGKNDVIKLKKYSPKPKIKPNKVLVKICAASINPIDLRIRGGYLKEIYPLKLPITLGGDFSGIVYEVGNQVTKFKSGDQVYGYAGVTQGGTGTLAEFALVDPKNIALKPKKINFATAAALPLVGNSSWEALVDGIDLYKGQKILIHGGAGGIGSIAIQLANFLGAYVATTVREKDIKFVMANGANEVIDYQKQPFEKILKNYDAVLDTVGGSVYKRSFAILKKGGTIISTVEKPRYDLIEQYEVNGISTSPYVTSERLTKLAELVDSGELKVHIDNMFPLQAVQDAFSYQETKHPQGKVIVVLEKFDFIAKIKHFIHL